ncbi:MAG TPA: hypothetical protein VN930_04150 [Xanthobacteraceae bacterium]|nr:hypothetical protein [Xanthobacteraceae bacterium]
MPAQRLMKLGLVPLAVAALLAGVLAASAQEEPTALQSVLGKLGILEIPSDDAPEYRERPPLVVPPAVQLPTPRNPEDIARQFPEWPKDQDLERRRKAAALKKRGVSSSVIDADFFSGRLLSRNELNRGTKKDADTGVSSNTAGAELAAGKERYSPYELGFKGWFVKEKPIVFTEEPVRQRLTEPPTGYRTPSFNAPYGMVESKQNNRIGSVFDRLDAGAAGR